METTKSTNSNGAATPYTPPDATEIADASEAQSSAAGPPGEGRGHTTATDVDDTLREAGIPIPLQATQQTNSTDGSPAAAQPAPTAAPTSEIGSTGAASPAPEFWLEKLPFTAVNRPKKLVMRDHRDEQAKDDYRKRYLEKEPMPPLEAVLLPDGQKVLVDGGHRWDAMVEEGITEAQFRVRRGTWEDAVKFAAAANQTHRGVRMTNADKAVACKNLWSVLGAVSYETIAKLAGVDGATAKAHEPEETKGQPKKGKDGKLRKARTTKPKNTNASAKQPAVAAQAATSKNPAAASTNGALHQEPQTTVTANVAASPPIEQRPSTAAPEPVDPSAANEPEEPVTLPTETITAQNGMSACLAVLSARGRSHIVLATFDQQAADLVVPLIERARAVGRDLTKAKGGDALALLELGIEHLETLSEQALREVERLAESEQVTPPVPPTIIA